MVIIDSKIIDYINFLMRAFDEIEDCSLREKYHLFEMISHLLIALMEENGPEPLEVARVTTEYID